MIFFKSKSDYTPGFWEKFMGSEIVASLSSSALHSREETSDFI